jgi:glycosyltransferase involved in cell wall biosynthesis
MNIAVDARELAGHPTGVGRYLAELLEQWAVSADAQRHRWQFFAHERIVVPAPFQEQVTVVSGSGGTRWEQWTLPRALAHKRPDVLFAPGYSAPLTAPCPTAVTIHDVSFAAHPEWFSFREGTRRRVLTAWSARRARVVVTVSAFSRDEIVKHLGIPAGKVRVIASGTSPTWRVTADERPRNTREHIVLYVGSIFGRRHVDSLIEAFVTSVAGRVPGSRLEIVGENRTYPRTDPAAALQRCSRDIAARVTLRSYVDDATLRDLYRRASVFAFLSEYEGFGLTTLEALAAGVPPIVLDTPVAREIYGDAARYVPADLSSPARLADGLVELLTDDHARAAILAHAGAVLARYDWTRSAEQTLRALEEAAVA